MSSNYERTITGDVDDLRSDADEVWDPARDRLLEVRGKLPTDLPASAFSFIPGADGVYRELALSCESLTKYVGDGEIAMHAFRDAVLWAALDIIGTEQSVQDDIAAIREQLNS
jgi:hypothetical protein